ncbi:glucose/sorbosone family PQQ-dependent dehydrogenase [Rodentibacter genomosp. 2]|uniref:Dehydrogenase n=1 Tax=Rodentibacter genomosp. 2 TaxID=1908266 RepID=A0A1V3JFB9_9PAST|nr:glucose/sorbosone family PQQ-dependent dehydrogenase [Rodentibacter genomosp. 2]OOF55139.1 dehydrogenase [Rodentibacter genomosp. 2]
MKKTALALALGALTLTSNNLYAKAGDKVDIAEPFNATVLVDGLESPWEMLWGKDNQLWITERQGKNIVKIDPKSGKRTVLYHFENAFSDPPHQGVLGLALAPEFLSGKGENYLYTAYTYNEGEKKFARIVRLTYDEKANKLVNETIVMDKLPASGDHNSGRLRFGPDGKLFYTIGDQGFGQGKHVDKEIQSQHLPTAEQVANKDYSLYPGKILRLNVDGSIPADNPELNGVKSHVYAYGFRNSQGLAFVGDKLFAVEHGPSSDDELNRIEKGGNYGWPNVAGYKDNEAYVYAEWFKAPKELQAKFDSNVIPEGVPVHQESEFNAPNFKAPQKTFFTVPTGYDYSDENCGKLAFLCWPTIAPSSIIYYPKDGAIKEWQNSLLITTLKSGAIYRVKLDGKSEQVQGDFSKHFKTDNRYRNAVISPDTRKIYVATDAVGYGLGKNGKPNTEMQNKGAIVVFEYTGK